MIVVQDIQCRRGGQRLVPLLKPHMKVLLEFGHIGHGMGDCIMFRSVYEELKRQFPDITFNLHCRAGQQLFNDITTDKYDLIFQVPMVENNSGNSKFRICAQQELGITWDSSYEYSWKLPQVPSSNILVPDNAIGLSFQSSSSVQKNLSEQKVSFIWNKVKECGFNPVQVHFQHPYKKQQNTRYSCIDFTCRDFPASVQNCIDVVSKCKGFISVPTGTVCIAMSLYPQRVLHLNTREHWVPKLQTDTLSSQLDCRRDTLNGRLLERFLYLCK